jgi:hypothetical protein
LIKHSGNFIRNKKNLSKIRIKLKGHAGHNMIMIAASPHSLPPAIKLNLKTITDRRNSQSIHSKNKRLSSACIVQTDFV